MRRVINRFPLVLLLVFTGVFAFGATAFAAGQVVDTNSSILDLAKPVYEAFSGGHYAYAAALLVVLIVALVKRYLGDRIKWLHSDAGGSSMALVAAMATAFAAGLAAPGAHVTWGLAKTALLVGIGAAGGFAVLKNLLVEPILQPLQKKLPAWAQPILSLVLWIFDHGQVAEQVQAEAKAVAAGDAAVVAKPAQGAAAVTGPAVELK